MSLLTSWRSCLPQPVTDKTGGCEMPLHLTPPECWPCRVPGLEASSECWQSIWVRESTVPWKISWHQVKGSTRVPWSKKNPVNPKLSPQKQYWPIWEIWNCEGCKLDQGVYNPIWQTPFFQQTDNLKSTKVGKKWHLWLENFVNYWYKMKHSKIQFNFRSI